MRLAKQFLRVTLFCMTPIQKKSNPLNLQHTRKPTSVHKMPTMYKPRKMPISITSANIMEFNNNKTKKKMNEYIKRIAVMSYNTGDIDIITLDDGIKYDDVEEFLQNDCNYNQDETYWMSFDKGSINFLTSADFEQ